MAILVSGGLAAAQAPPRVVLSAQVEPPRQVEVVVAAPPSVRLQVAVVAGLIAVAAGGAAGTLAFINVREAAVLNGTMRGGLIPLGALDRAVAIDERTLAAPTLGIGAGVAAAVAVGALLMKNAPVQLSPSVGPSGAGITLLGRLP